MNWIAKFIGNNYNDKQIAKLQPLVKAINQYDEQWMSLTDDDIKAKTGEFKSRYQAGETLDDLLPEAFAAVKQASRRMVGQSLPVKDTTQVWDMVPYDVQLIGGIVLHQGKVAEMRTGEGKTLVATLPAYLNALSGNPVHVVTVNDYLASRDAEWMGHLYQWLGLTVGSINKYTPIQDHRAQYEADIIYVESTEIGFDYLRDNLEKDPKNRRLLNRGLHFAIVDEADSVFIDEARTPMIMSQANNDPIDKYVRYASLVQSLIPSSKAKKVSKGFLAELMKEDAEESTGPDGDYYLDEKSKAVTLSELGITKLENLLGVENLYRDLGYDEIHHIENALSAKAAYHEGKEYIIQGDEVMIVDENTGRIMPGRRFQGGLHQAIEAKEKMTIKQEAKTIATITYQHFFKLYKKLSGMTGTATTEGEELEKIYDLEVLSIPTNKPIHRVDRNDRVFFDQNSKWKATLDTVQFYNHIGQPILIGTSSIHTSELVSTLLRQSNINHYVLNAKFFEQEATIVGNGGQFGSVVVATNMAGRGTDIKLEKGLNEKLAANYATWIGNQLAKQGEVGLILNIASQLELDLLMKALGDNHGYQLQTKLSKGGSQPYASITINQSSIAPTSWLEKDIQFGLFVLGTEKHDSRRIDNQLRGRAGRQGDPGVSQFYVSFDDEIMRKMGGAKMQSLISMASAFLGDQSEMEKELSSRTMFTDSIVRAQTQMEAHNYSIRKHLYDYDSVVNKQRLKVYGKRDEILNEATSTTGEQTTYNIISDSPIYQEIKGWVSEIVNHHVSQHNKLGTSDEELLEELKQDFVIEWTPEMMEDINSKGKVSDAAIRLLTSQLERWSSQRDAAQVHHYMKNIYLDILDEQWIEHIDTMQHLRDKVGLYGYAQQDPLLIYKAESYDLFEQLWITIKSKALNTVFRQIKQSDDTTGNLSGMQVEVNNVVDVDHVITNADQFDDETGDNPQRKIQTIEVNTSRVSPNVQVVTKADKGGKVGPNDPCPCGSGKKYKKCHGA